MRPKIAVIWVTHLIEIGLIHVRGITVSLDCTELDNVHTNDDVTVTVAADAWKYLNLWMHWEHVESAKNTITVNAAGSLYFTDITRTTYYIIHLAPSLPLISV